MFSNTAYEALYQYLGLELHSQFISAITSEVFFKAVVLIIFGLNQVEAHMIDYPMQHQQALPWNY